MGRKAQSTHAKKVARALECMTYKSPMGEVRMHKTGHQLEAPQYLGICANQGSKGVKYDAEKTGYGFRSEVAWDNYISAQPTSCQRSGRPERSGAQPCPHLHAHAFAVWQA